MTILVWCKLSAHRLYWRPVAPVCCNCWVNRRRAALHLDCRQPHHAPLAPIAAMHAAFQRYSMAISLLQRTTVATATATGVAVVAIALCYTHTHTHVHDALPLTEKKTPTTTRHTPTHSVLKTILLFVSYIKFVFKSCKHLYSSISVMVLFLIYFYRFLKPIFVTLNTICVYACVRIFGGTTWEFRQHQKFRCILALHKYRWILLHTEMGLKKKKIYS